MAYCQKCGTEIPNEAKFCTSCGEKLEQNNAARSDDSSTSQTSQNGYVEDRTIQEMFLKTTGRLNRLRYFKRTFIFQFIVGFISGFVGVVDPLNR